jgi:hypothetical protein
LERVAQLNSLVSALHSVLKRRMKGRKKMRGKVGFIVAGQESRAVLMKILTKK